MRLPCKIGYHEGVWLVDVPELRAMTQGDTKEEALEMAVDLVRTFLEIEVTHRKGGKYEITITKPASRAGK